MRILVDTNVVLDVALERRPFLRNSEQVLAYVEQGTVEGYISASTFTDLYYVIRKARGKEWALGFLSQLLTFFQIATVDQGVIVHALQSRFEDLEDSVQYETAIANQLQSIVTRNPEDFPNHRLEIFTPESLIQQLSGRKLP